MEDFTFRELRHIALTINKLPSHRVSKEELIHILEKEQDAVPYIECIILKKKRLEIYLDVENNKLRDLMYYSEDDLIGCEQFYNDIFHVACFHNSLAVVKYLIELEPLNHARRVILVDSIFYNDNTDLSMLFIEVESCIESMFAAIESFFIYSSEEFVPNAIRLLLYHCKSCYDKFLDIPKVMLI
jgi:hypothetical protein